MLQAVFRQKWARYATVQVVGYALDLLVFIVLFRLFGQPVLVANIAAKTCAATTTFFGQKYLTFEKAGTGRAFSEAALYFLLVAINGFVASTLLLALRSHMWAEAAKIIADGLVFALSYFVTKHLVFGTRRRTGDS